MLFTVWIWMRTVITIVFESLIFIVQHYISLLTGLLKDCGNRGQVCERD